MIKVLCVLLPLFLFIGKTVAEEKITVEISGVDDELGGNLFVLVFGDDGFPKEHEKSLLTQTEKVTNKKMTFALAAPSENYLAIKVLHDEDANKKVTKNWAGIWPREGLGFSNGKRMGAFGPPGFEDAKISREMALKGIKIDVVYP